MTIRLLSVVALVAITISSPVSARQFAIVCSGTSKLTDTVTGRLIERVSVLPNQIYVVGEGEKTVKHALEPRQEFEDVCDAGGGGGEVDVSPGLILVKSSSRTGTEPNTTCNFEANRQAGAARSEIRIEFADDRYDLNVWMMQCRPAPIPTFQPEKNKF